MMAPNDEGPARNAEPSGQSRGAAAPITTISLNDGASVTLRPIRPEDESGLTALYSRLSRETAYQRFFTVMGRPPPSWAHILANVDHARRMAIVAVGPGNELVGVARYDLDEAADEAEVAIVVQDEWQGKGLGTAMVVELLRYAQAHGIRRFRADVLSENRRMLEIIERLAVVLERHVERGVTSLVFAPRPAPRLARRPAAPGGPRTP